MVPSRTLCRIHGPNDAAQDGWQAPVDPFTGRLRGAPYLGRQRVHVSLPGLCPGMPAAGPETEFHSVLSDRRPVTSPNCPYNRRCASKPTAFPTALPPNAPLYSAAGRTNTTGTAFTAATAAQRPSVDSGAQERTAWRSAARTPPSPPHTPGLGHCSDRSTRRSPR